MSRERTEQGNSMTHGETIDCLIDEHKRLKERVRYLEEIELLWGKLVAYHQNKQKEAEDANEPYRHENKRLREAIAHKNEALKFYADEKNYGYHLHDYEAYKANVMDEGGAKARQALEEVNE